MNGLRDVGTGRLSAVSASVPQWRQRLKEGRNMLVLSRKRGETIVIGNGITVKVLAVNGDRVKLGVVAPVEVPVHREEVHQRIGDCPVALRFAECA